ncbi:hypothetical protein B0H11DRAFT_2025346 [Mycena galericulata]|nr:hypothetical protein B0H11DRAFT_2025346 [Mycena galericulata]
MDQTMEPRLPHDLEREIFETTALIHPNMIPTLLRVARRVLIWVEPMLYRVIKISRGRPYEDLANAVLAKPPDFLRDAVRHLFLDSAAQWSQEDALKILPLCTGLVSLLPLRRFSNPTLIPTLAGMRLRRLSTSLVDLFGGRDAVDIHHPMFSALTHIDIFDDIGDVPKIYTHMSALPSLTHLCLNNEIPWDILRLLLSDCRHLQVLVNMWAYLRADRAWALAQKPPLTDHRFVVTLYRDYWEDWDAGAHGETDFWALAEIFVARKQRGEIAASCYWLEG